MIAIRSICIISFLLLSACAHRSPIETHLSPEPSQVPQVSVETETPSNNKESVSKTTDQPESTANEPEALSVHSKTLAENKKGSKDIAAKSAEKEKKVAKSSTSAASRVSSWDISGALAARSKNKGWSASVNWMQRGASQYQIRLSGPLGSGAVMISRSGGAVTLRDGPKTVTSSSAESLLKKQTGVSLPVTNLYYWIRGVPAPAAIQGEKRDPAGHLTQLKQAGYTIQYLQYTSAGGTLLPTHVRLQGNGIFIKFIIRNWRL
ncbi:lipoprotein insertase outer membrane protein LolB [Legionella micdadei]|uniref:Outer-membrane lipoprotein LolB n=1 Tax=Legionella micdadei TaxID=451 RepID=A0A098GCE9_LEGMI|nr:lipoprotein insertase outer membrane protein LolB [Legionella micdadei]ARG96450.1 outer membrane lipoprotein LolB [Legionella micdadei]ARG99200.1 outer membrane lipoprotein LolB [Legionella micdadei]KTD29458.1 outer membrane lipoprotein LolB [Legionella micdadei]NSL18144.1 outer membrane lipoprotein LolB [Legionella micdadei]CEG59660.1 Outer membrane lipoprotein LolB (modular protein) [Legionella micdadei]